MQELCSSPLSCRKRIKLCFVHKLHPWQAFPAAQGTTRAKARGKGWGGGVSVLRRVQQVLSNARHAFCTCWCAPYAAGIADTRTFARWLCPCWRMHAGMNRTSHTGDAGSALNTCASGPDNVTRCRCVRVMPAPALSNQSPSVMCAHRSPIACPHSSSRVLAGSGRTSRIRHQSQHLLLRSCTPLAYAGHVGCQETRPSWRSPSSSPEWPFGQDALKRVDVRLLLPSCAHGHMDRQTDRQTDGRARHRGYAPDDGAEPKHILLVCLVGSGSAGAIPFPERRWLPTPHHTVQVATFPANTRSRSQLCCCPSTRSKLMCVRAEPCVSCPITRRYGDSRLPHERLALITRRNASDVGSDARVDGGQTCAHTPHLVVSP